MTDLDPGDRVAARRHGERASRRGVVALVLADDWIVVDFHDSELSTGAYRPHELTRRRPLDDLPATNRQVPEHLKRVGDALAAKLDHLLDRPGTPRPRNPVAPSPGSGPSPAHSLGIVHRRTASTDE